MKIPIPRGILCNWELTLDRQPPEATEKNHDMVVLIT